MRVVGPFGVRVGAGALAAAAAETTGTVLVLTDANVEPLHRARLTGLEEAPTCVVSPGEPSKSLAVLERVLGEMAAAGLDRGSSLVALGGGVVGDLGGLAASLYMRGIAVVQCPTTLLAQVDASVGGKTAVNLAAGRNLAGTFHAPRAVLADVDALATLPEVELRSGLGEAVKTALVEPAPDAGGLLGVLEARAEDLAGGDPEALEEVVARCVAIKSAVVDEDEREAGPRKVLNLGHTFAHAIESAGGYAVPHGLAVAAGLALSLAAARAAGILADAELPGRVDALLARLGLPRGAADVLAGVDADAVVEAMRLDKKARGGAPRLVLPRAAGDLALDVELEPRVLRAIVDGSAVV